MNKLQLKYEASQMIAESYKFKQDDSPALKKCGQFGNCVEVTVFENSAVAVRRIREHRHEMVRFQIGER